MTEVYLKLNYSTERFDCYSVLTDEFICTLSCNTTFIYIDIETDEEIVGRIEYVHGKHYGYCWVDKEESTTHFLYDGMRGYIC